MLRSKRLGAAQLEALARWTYVEYRRLLSSRSLPPPRRRSRGCASAPGRAVGRRRLGPPTPSCLPSSPRRWSLLSARRSRSPSTSGARCRRAKRRSSPCRGSRLAGSGVRSELSAAHHARVARAGARASPSACFARKHRSAARLSAARASWKDLAVAAAVARLKAIGTNADDIWDRILMIAATPRPYTRRRWCAERGPRATGATRRRRSSRGPGGDPPAARPRPSAKKGIVSRVRVARRQPGESAKRARESAKRGLRLGRRRRDGHAPRARRRRGRRRAANREDLLLRRRVGARFCGECGAAPASRSSAPNAASGSRRATRRHARRDRAKALFVFYRDHVRIDRLSRRPPASACRSRPRSSREASREDRSREKKIFFFFGKGHDRGKNAKTFGSKKVNGHFLHVRKCASVDREHNRAARSPARGGEGARGGACRCCTGESEPPACCATARGLT